MRLSPVIHRSTSLKSLRSAVALVSALALTSAPLSVVMAQSAPAAPEDEAWREPPSTPVTPLPVELGAGRYALSVGASVLPGLLVHGSGHFAAGRYDDGKFLLAMEGLGLLLLVGGFGGLAVTGAAPEVNPQLIWIASSGAGLFFFSWGADLYGSIVQDGEGAGRAWRTLPSLELSQGYQYVYNPVFEDHHYSRTAMTLRTGDWSVQGAFWWAPPHGQRRLETRVGWRLYGPTQDKAAWDGTALDVIAGYDYNAVPAQDTSAHVGSLALTGRLDLQRVLSTGRGAFVEGSLGQAWANYRYGLTASEFNSLLISRIAFGLYLGHDPDGYGELSIAYDHRHDGFVGGAKIVGLGSGAIGGAQLRLKKSLFGRWGMDLGFGAGSAYVADAAVVYMWGGQR